MYEFDQLVPYIVLEARIKNKWYYKNSNNGRNREADELALWVMKAPAMEQAKNNLARMLELASENGFA